MLLVERLYTQYLNDKVNYDKIEKYYLGHSDAVENYVKTERSNLKVNLNYLKKFVKEETAYSVGNPVTYQTKDEDDTVIADIDDVLENFK